MQIHFELIARALDEALVGKFGVEAYNVLLDYIQTPQDNFLDYINKLYYVDCSITKAVYEELHNIA